MFSIKTRRSAGVRVTAAVHHLLATGNAARDRQDWARAAATFRQALTADPGLAHIWVQLGNMAKEQGQTEEAESAYLRAVRLRPKDAEPLLQLGHLFNLNHEPVKAGRYYLGAFQANPHLIDAATALHRIIGNARGRRRQELVEVLRQALADVPDHEPAPRQAVTPGQGGVTRTCLVFDVSDLIGYFAHGRLPTGIQRVQIEIISHALRADDADVMICCFIEGRGDWLQIPPDLFLRTVALSLKDGRRDDVDWIVSLHQLHLHMALSEPLAFRHGSYLVNLGSSWQLPNYFLFVREAKRRHAIRYVPFVHDLIPILAPEHFTKPARREVVPWVIGVFAHADHVLVNSQSTRRDFLKTGDMLGRSIDPADIAVIRLDADCRKPELESLPEGALARWGLAGEAFVLLVSTVESRKGHVTALDAWSRLIERHGAAQVPKLVCAGKRGWLSQVVYQRLGEDTLLASRVAMLSMVSDAELSLLYRTCLFTLYPSLYEGWGLPITEALCYGKAVIASDTSSLPEAGGDFAIYVAPGSGAALATAVDRMAFDADYRRAIEARIAARFSPRSWSDLASQVRAELARMAERDSGSSSHLETPQARLGAYHSMARGTALRLWHGAGLGEMFRAGVGWGATDGGGSWTAAEGGALAIGLPPRQAALRIGLHLLGAPNCDVDWQVRIKHGPHLSGSLEKGGRKWVTLTYPVVDDGGILRLHVRSVPTGADGAADDDMDAEEWQTVGVAGFFLYRQDDAAAAMQLLEAIAMGNLDIVDAYRDEAASAALVDDPAW